MKYNYNFEDNFDHIPKPNFLVKYEEMILNNENFFFDREDLEEIIDYYGMTKEPQKSLQACDIAISLYPFVQELQRHRIKLLAQMKLYTEVLIEIEEAKQKGQYDWELIIIEKEIYLAQEKYRKAVTLLEENADKITPQDLMFFNEQKEKLYEYPRENDDENDEKNNEKESLKSENLEKNFLKKNASKNEFQAEIQAEIANIYNMFLGENIRATKHYQRALTLYNAMPIVAWQLADIWQALGLLDKKIKFFQDFIDKDAFDTWGWYNMGVAYRMLGKIADAIYAFDYAVTIDENMSEAYYEMGCIYMDDQNYKEAQKSFTMALDFGEQNPHLLCCLGASYEKQKDFTAAVINYKEAIKMDKYFDEAFYGIATCMQSQQKFHEAIFYFRKALEISPEEGKYWLTLAEAEYNLGNVISALECFTKASIHDEQNEDVWLKWSFFFWEQGNFETALETIEDGLEHLPHQASLHYRASLYAFWCEDFKKASQYMEFGLLLSPDDDEMMEILGFFEEKDQEKLKKFFKMYKMVEKKVK